MLLDYKDDLARYLKLIYRMKDPEVKTLCNRVIKFLLFVREELRSIQNDSRSVHKFVLEEDVHVSTITYHVFTA